MERDQILRISRGCTTDDIEALRTYLGDHQDDDWEHFCVGIEQLEGEIVE